MPVIKPVHMTLFPTLDSLQDVVHLAETRLPVADRNVLFSLLMSYHNTLLKVINGKSSG